MVMAVSIVPNSQSAETRFAQFMKEWMERRGVRPAWIAQQSGIGRSTVSYWLNGTTLPDRESLEILAEALDLEYAFLRDLVEDVEPSPEAREQALRAVLVDDPEKVSALNWLGRNLSPKRLSDLVAFLAAEAEEDRRTARSLKRRRRPRPGDGA